MTVHPFPRLSSRTADRMEPCHPQRPASPAEMARRKATDEVLDHLEEMLDGQQPFAFLDFASKGLTEIGPEVGDYLALLRRCGLYEAAMLATATEWLATGEQPDSVLDPDTPSWLINLDKARFVDAMVTEPNAESSSYLVGIELVDGSHGTLQARIDHKQQEVLTNYFVNDGAVDTLARLLAAATRVDTCLPTPIDPALDTLSHGLDQYNVEPLPPESRNPWPANRPLLDFTLAHFGGTRT